MNSQAFAPRCVLCITVSKKKCVSLCVKKKKHKKPLGKNSLAFAPRCVGGTDICIRMYVCVCVSNVSTEAEAVQALWDAVDVRVDVVRVLQRLVDKLI